MKSLLHPAAGVNARSLALWVVALLIASAILVLVAAVAMPDAYSWRAHSISESAAQGLQHAWIAGVPFDEFEDFLHSVTATGTGFAFCFGVVARCFQRNRIELLNRALDVLALVVATGMPMLSALYSASGGLIQRAMFVVAYVWYGTEALGLRSSQARSP